MKNTLVLAVIGLAAATAANADLVLLDGRLTCDALLLAGCRWRSSETQGVADSRFSFYRGAAFLGFTGRVGRCATFRAYLDVSRATAYDLYVDFRWPSGLLLRVGQFIPPLGVEAGTPDSALDFIEYSMVERHWKPWGARDIGAMVGYVAPAFSIAGAVVNGSGRGDADDENDWKDLCGRIALRPFSCRYVEVASRGYYGRYYDEGVLFWNIAGELLFEQRLLHALVQVQHTVWGDVSRNSLSAQAAYDLSDVLEPVIRGELELQSEDRYSIAVTAGVNVPLLGERLLVKLNYTYSRRESIAPQNRVSEHRVAAQLQAGF